MNQRVFVGDIGGTNARFAVATLDDDGAVRLGDAQTFAAGAFASFQDLIGAAYDAVGAPGLDHAAVACAGPVVEGRVHFTNLNWSAAEAPLSQALSVPDARLLNDLAAVAWAAPRLGGDDLVTIKPGAAQVEGGPVAVMGVGTGANAAAITRTLDGRPAVMVGEAGHVSFAPTTEAEVEIWRALTKRFGRVSVERLASGPGMLNLYEALAEIQRQPAPCKTPPEVAARARDGDPLASAALDQFVQILGGLAGDLALTFGATGGLYIAGGVAPGLKDALSGPRFAERFHAKGRFETYMAAIPVKVIVHPFAALIGAAASVRYG